LGKAYATGVFTEAGYTRVEFADARTYHNFAGGVHCGTNAIRQIPSGKWWLSVA